jgi:uncharacterized OsmC-like protein
MVSARHEEGYRFRLQAGRHTIVSDQRQEYGGLDAGPMPGELFLTSVASCFGMAVYHVARKMRVDVPELALEVGGEKHADEFRFHSVSIAVRARCPQARLERMVELAKKYCFVTKSLDPAVALEFRVEGHEP